MEIKCPKCGILKDEIKFHKSRSQKNGRQSYCKECQNENAKRWKRGSRSSYDLQYKYDLTKEEFDELSKACEICGTDKNLCVDHNADFGFVRGILCKSCNFGIGNFKHDPELFQRAIEYLKRTN